MNSGLEQLKEMQFQRTHAQEPDVFIESQELEVDYKSQDIVFDSSWRKDEVDYCKENPLPITLTNIGNGVAKHVTVTLFFQRAYLEDLEKIDRDKELNIELSDTDDGKSYLDFRYRGNQKESIQLFNIITSKSKKINYISSEQSVDIILDYEFMRILNLHMFLNSKIKSNSEKFVIPELKAVITYYDSFHNEYIKDGAIYIGSYRTNLGNNRHTVSFKLNGINENALKQVGK